METKHLFIGGCADGKRMTTEDLPYFRVPYQVPFCHEANYPVHTYRREDMYFAHGQRLIFYVWDVFSPLEFFTLLLNNYTPKPQ
jgi:hypothetical protein